MRENFHNLRTGKVLSGRMQDVRYLNEKCQQVELNQNQNFVIETKNPSREM